MKWMNTYIHKYICTYTLYIYTHTHIKHTKVAGCGNYIATGLFDINSTVKSIVLHTTDL